MRAWRAFRRASSRGGSSVFRRSARSILAEILVGLEFVRQLARDEFDHDGVVEIADARNAVRDEVVRVDEVRHGIEDARAIVTFEPPVAVTQHLDQLLQLPDSLDHEVGRLRGDGFFHQVHRAADHDRLVARAVARADLLQAIAEEADVTRAEFETDLHVDRMPPFTGILLWHGIRASGGSASSLTRHPHGSA